MATVVYKNHFIICSTRFDSATETWFPSIVISWETDSRQESHTLDAFVKGFDNSQQAEAWGTKVAKAWIDRQL
jgi:hypothetical protein